MNEDQMKIIAESLGEASKLGTVNALTYIQKGLEAYKTVQIPTLNSNEPLRRMPYFEDEGVRTFVDFMLVYLDEAIKVLEKGKSN